ncbi:hypothetical protein [Pseudactinotalea sp.]|uniref:hypothetical protein n=1 Tax=Pseudactinotalea sp. TaxID=1926260 RepID=UPI003B3A8641
MTRLLRRGMLVAGVLGVGLAVSAATADEAHAGPLDGLLDPVTDVVDEVLSPVSDDVVAPLVEDVVVPVVDQAVVPVVEEVVEPVAPVVEEVVEPIAPVVEDVVVPVIDEVAEPVVPVVEDVVAPVTESVVAPVVEVAVEPVLDQVAPVTDAALAPVVDALEPVMTPVAGLLLPVTGLIGDVIEPLAPITDALEPVVEPLQPLIPVGVRPEVPAAQAPSPLPDQLPIGVVAPSADVGTDLDVAASVTPQLVRAGPPLSPQDGTNQRPPSTITAAQPPGGEADARDDRGTTSSPGSPRGVPAGASSGAGARTATGHDAAAVMHGGTMLIPSYREGADRDARASHLSTFFEVPVSPG